MSFSFPQNPNINDQSTQNGRNYLWTGYAWELVPYIIDNPSISDINGLQSALDSKQPSGSYANSSHSHLIADVSGLQTSLDSKQPSGSYADSIHYHTSNDITDFNSSVSGLLSVKNILSGSGIQIDSISGIYTITSSTTSSNASATSLATQCYNSTGYTIPKMSVVYINGGNGNLPTIELAIAKNESGSSKTFGITSTEIAHNHSGDVVVFGQLIDVNTNQFSTTEGSVLYLSPTNSGEMTVIKPSAPDHMVSVGKIIRNHNNQGIITVVIQNGFELQELHNVATNDVSDGQLLQYNLSSGLWIPTSTANFTSLKLNNTNVSVSGHTHSIDDISGLQTSLDSKQPSGSYANLSHNHTSSNISDFSSSVSGLLTPYQLSITNPITGIGTSGYLSKFNTSSTLTNSLIIESGGNIGINTSNPLSALHIYNSGTTRTLIEINSTGILSPLNMYNSNSGVNSGAGMLFSAGSSPTASTSFIGGVASTRNSDLLNSITYIRAASSGVVSALSSNAPFAIKGLGTTINSFNTLINGSLGINTQNPVSALEVSGLITSNSGNFTSTLQVNGTGVSLNGHTHSASDISTGTLSDNVLSSKNQAAMNLYLWANFR